jgi:3-oxoadipate enol-lactonase
MGTASSTLRVARTVARQGAARALRTLVSAPVVETVPQGRTVELPGRGSTYVVDVPGPQGAPTLVLLHALGCTGHLGWYPVIADLAEHYRVVILDQRWHGRGIRSRRFRLDDCADDVVALLDVLGIEQAVPVGYSMGGLVAQLVWRRHPDRVAGLVLCSTARNFRGKRREQLFFPVMSTAMLPLSPYCRGRVERVASALPAVPSVAAAEKGWGLVEFRSTSAWSMAAVLEELGRFNSAGWIGEVDVPASVVVTIRDRAVPARRQRRLAESMPGAEIVEVAGGHVALMFQADRFKAALLEAVASVVARGDHRTARVG